MTAISTLNPFSGIASNPQARSALGQSSSDTTQARNTSSTQDTVNLSPAALAKQQASPIANGQNKPSPEISEALTSKVMELVAYLYEEPALSDKEEAKVASLTSQIDKLENQGLNKTQLATREKLYEQLDTLLEKDNPNKKQQAQITQLEAQIDKLQPKLSKEQQSQLDGLYEQLDGIVEERFLDIDPDDFPEIASLTKELDKYLTSGDTEKVQSTIAALADYVLQDPEDAAEPEYSAEQEKQMDNLNQKIDKLENYGLSQKQIQQRLSLYEKLDGLLDKEQPNAKQEDRIDQLVSTLSKPNPNLSQAQVATLNKLDTQLGSIEDSGTTKNLAKADFSALGTLTKEITNLLSKAG